MPSKTTKTTAKKVSEKKSEVKTSTVKVMKNSLNAPVYDVKGAKDGTFPLPK